MKQLLVYLFVGCWLLFPLACGANTISLDLDPTAPGVQDTATVAAGEAFDVDVFITGIAPNTMQGFQFDLAFAALAGATDVQEGGFLNGLFGTFVLKEEIAPPAVEFVMTALGTPIHGESGVLAAVSFIALTQGIGALSLQEVVLVDTQIPTQSLPINGINNATVIVSAVPLPATLGLFTGAILMLLGLRRRKRFD